MQNFSLCTSPCERGGMLAGERRSEGLCFPWDRGRNGMGGLVR